MSLPEQVRKQSEQVKQFYEGQPAEGEPDPNQPPDPASADPARDAGDPDPHAPEDGGDSGGSTDYEQKWRSLQGSYNAQVRRGNELEQRMSQMQALLATMSEAQARPPAAEPAEVRLLSEEEVTDFGDSIDVMRKVSREELSPLVQRLVQIEQALGNVTSRVIPQVQDLAVRQHQSAEQTFWSTLNQLVPDWRVINEDPEFQAWLLEVDPLTGHPRQAFLEQAQQAFDAHRVAQFFGQWRGGPAPQPAPGGGNGASPSELEMQVAPGRTRSSAPASRNQKVYTAADIAKFYDDVRKGNYRGREEEKGRIERDIFTAQQEGRIVG